VSRDRGQIAEWDVSNGMLSALQALRAAAPDSLDIPDPWRGYFHNALETVREEIE